jgi:hypothetical protein
MSQPLVELQISASAFLNAQLLTVQMRKLSFPPPIAIGDHQIAIDHVEFGTNHLDHSQSTQAFISVREPGAGIERVPIIALEVQLAQPLTVFLADLADVIGHPNQPPAQLIPVTATIFVRLTYTVDGFNQDRLGFEFARVVLDPLPPLPPGIDGNALQQQFQNFAQSIVPNSSISLGLAGKITGGGEAVQIINLGVSTDNDLTFLALRVELGDGIEADPQLWQAFFQGNIANRLQQAGFALFLAGGVLENIFANQISAGLSGSDQFELVSGVDCTYSVDGSAAKLQAKFSGNVDAPICTVWADITVDGRLLVNQPNTMTVDVNVGVQLSTSACQITAAFLGAALGLLANFVVPLSGLIVLPILGAMTGVAAVLIVASNQGGGGLPVPDCNQVSDTHLVCTRTVPLTKTPLGQLSFDSMSVFDDGVSLQGKLVAIPVGAPKLKIEPGEFSYLPPIISCGEFSKQQLDDFKKNPKAHVSLSVGVNIEADSIVPIYLLDAHVINDPLGVFTNGLVILGNQAPLSLSVDVGYPGDTYFQNPYPCQILVSTTGGERLVSIPPPPVLTQDEINRLGSQLDEQIGNCFEQVNNWFDGGVFNPQWLVDPGPGDKVVDHYYDFVVNGLAAGQLVTVVGGAQQVLVNGVSFAGESLHVDALVAPGTKEIGLLRNKAGSSGGDVVGAFKSLAGAIEGAHKNAAHGVGVTEQLIVRTATIPLPAPCLRLIAAYSDGVPCVFAVLSDRILAFDLSVPSTPVARLTAPIPGLRGVTTNQAGLVAFGDGGFYSVDSRGGQPATCGCGGDSSVFGAVGAGNVIYAITDAGLELFSPRFSRLSTIQVEASGPLARAGNKLVAANDDGLAVFSIVHPKRPERKEGFKMSGVRDLVTPPGGAGKTLLAIANDGTSKLVDFSRGDDPKAVADYPQFPWYVGSARLGDLFLKLDPTTSMIQVSLFGKSQLL